MRTGEPRDRKSTRLNSSHTVIYTLSLHDALPIYIDPERLRIAELMAHKVAAELETLPTISAHADRRAARSEEHTSELQSHSDLHSFPTRRSSDLYRSRTPAHC